MQFDITTALGFVVGLLSVILTYYYRYYYYKPSRASPEEEKFVVEFLSILRNSVINSTYFVLNENPEKDIVYSTQYNFFNYVNSPPFSRSIGRKAKKLPVILEQGMFGRNFINYYNHPYLPEDFVYLLNALDFKPLNKDSPFTKSEVLERREGFVLIDDQVRLNIVLGVGLCPHKYMAVVESHYYYVEGKAGKPLTLKDLNVVLEKLNERIIRWLKERQLLHLYKKEIRGVGLIRESLKVLNATMKDVRFTSGAEIMKVDRRLIDDE